MVAPPALQPSWTEPSPARGRISSSGIPATACTAKIGTTHRSIPTECCLSGPARAYHPIRIAQFALHRFDLWYATRNAAARRDVLAQATWLRDRQGTTPLPASIDSTFRGKNMARRPAGVRRWRKGEAISVLLRAHALDAVAGYADAAERASQPFFADIKDGGVVWRDGANLFLEEIANEHAPHVLNGCIFALWGIWELWKRTDDAGLERVVEACGRYVAPLVTALRLPAGGRAIVSCFRPPVSRISRRSSTTSSTSLRCTCWRQCSQNQSLSKRRGDGLPISNSQTVARA